MINAKFFLDITPDYASWNDWHSNVIHILSEQNLPHVPDENEWKLFANELQDNPALAAFALPDPIYFASWQEWATNLLAVSNGRIRA